ncbi:MAG: prepilin-type N-terminal cleavage/methylation domain-containing protein [Candidatus Harrisonbacteria bacterium]|nr:prepilin-type N-terminal cleavage/methylation domain-containing protein [Candidatus Harrisonbacteria bacterium]
MRGFTLIELLIVTAISVVVFTVGVLGLANYRTEQDLRIATREVVTVLQEASGNALTGEDGFAWGVRFMGGPRGTASLFSLDGDTYRFIATTTLKSGIEFRDPAASQRKDAVFERLTGYVAGGGTVIIKLGVVGNDNSSTTITIYANGRIVY